jgi:sugar phosphate isomerase/epimerase
MDKTFPFKMGIQTILDNPGNISAFSGRLDFIAGLGFHCVELNIPYPGQTDLVTVKKQFDDSGLILSNFASGATANVEKLSLSSSDGALRERSVGRTLELLEIAARFNAGFIIGFLKGNSDLDGAVSREFFVKSIAYGYEKDLKVASGYLRHSMAGKISR